MLGSSERIGGFCRLVRQLPGSFEEVFGAALRFVPASSRTEADDPSSQQRVVQTELIRGPDRWRNLLVDRLPSWVTPVRRTLFVILCILLHGVPAKSQGASCRQVAGKDCHYPTPSWTRHVLAEPNQPWARCSVFLPPPASRGKGHFYYE